MSTSTRTPLILENACLRSQNSFGLSARSKYYTEIRESGHILRLLDSQVYQRNRHYILGGGSNILLPEYFEGLIIKIAIPGITPVAETADHVVLDIGAGINWDELVRYSLHQNLGGLENLAMIPGSAGAAPIQNIGAYGAELSDVFESLQAVCLKSGNMEEFDQSMCRFGYRESIFKTKEQQNYLICRVRLRLKRKHTLNLSYGNIREVLSQWGIRQPNIHDVSKAVRHIRSSKLPDPAITGNAGSFFKNPIIHLSEFERLREKFANLPGTTINDQIPRELPGIYKGGSGEFATDKTSFDLKQSKAKSSIDTDLPIFKSIPSVKIPAAWLIEQCGFKGYRRGDAGVYERHALILVNHGKASASEILELARNIRQKVHDTFGIVLESEVHLIDSKL